MSRMIRLRVCAICAVVVTAGCNLNLQSTPTGGIVGSFEILGQTFSFTLGNVGAIPVTANQPSEAAVGFRLFDEPPATTPPSGVMTLPSANVGVGQLLSKTARVAAVLPLNGTGTIRFSVAAGNDASLCSSAILLAEYDFVYNTGVVAVLQEDFAISPQALSVLVANDVTICISITTDFDAAITISGFDIAFGGSAGSLTAALSLRNDDVFEIIHILTPGEDFNPATNRLTPGSTRNVTVDVVAGATVTLRAGREGVVLDTATCPAVTGSDYQAEASWNGSTLTCTATQSGSGSGSGAGSGSGNNGGGSVPDGTIIQVPVDNASGSAAIAPVTSTIGGVDYGVVGVLYDQTPLTPFPIVEPTAMSVDLSALGLASVSTIFMAVHSSFVPDLSNGVDMGTLTVTYAEGGAPTTLDFVLGGNTAEWSYDRPENAPVSHSLATTLYTFPTMIDSAFEYEGREYAVSLAVDSTRTIACVTLLLPPATTYAGLRDPGDPGATFASQYVAAMTLEGPAGSPSIIGDCSGSPTPSSGCDADGVCDPTCAPGDDPDCAGGAQPEECSANGVCNDACTAADPDPDCVEDCSADGVCNENCSDLDPDPDCTAPDPSTPACTVRSTFDSGDEGWTLLGDAEGGRAEPDFHFSGGNPGPFVSADDDAAGGIWLWKAPSKFHGNFAAAFGKTLTFDLEQSSLSAQFDSRDIILIGNGGVLIWFDTPMNPGLDFTSYAVPLDASSGWMLDDDTAAPESTIRAVLADLEDFQIRGEFVSGADTGGLDNVVLNSGCP